MTYIAVTGNKTQTIVTGVMGPAGPAGAASINELTDIDKTGLVGGATLIYNSSTSQWVATKLLDNQILEAGQF